MEGTLVEPNDVIEYGSLQLLESTIAEMCVAAGDRCVPRPGDSGRDREVQLEARLLTHNVVKFSSRRLGDASHPWSFVVSEPVDIEAAFVRRCHPADLSKMALARQIQLQECLTDHRRDFLWTFSSDLLLAAYLADPSTSPSNAMAVAKAKCGGRATAKAAGLG
jgi:hypothetical protein